MANNKQYAVLGLGRFGESIVHALAENGKDVLACDKNPEIVQKLSNVATHVVRADISDESTLNALGLNNFDCVIIAAASDMEATIMATMSAKEAGVRQVIVKAKNKTHETILKKVGADRIVSPEREMGTKVAQSLLNQNVVEYINLSENYTIAEISPISKWVGKNLIDTDLRNEYNINVIVIKRGKKLIISPAATEVIEKDDVLLVVASNSSINKVGEIYDAENSDEQGE
ncbi:MAG: potassium channel family protein [Lachnospirales bacterium]